MLIVYTPFTFYFFMKKCIRCELSVPDVKFQTPGSKHCIKCTNALYYIRNKEKFKQKHITNYYSNLEESRKMNAKNRAKWRAANPDKIKIENKKKYDRVKADPIKYQKQLEAVRKKKLENKYYNLQQAYRDRSKNNLTDNYIKRTLLDRHGGILRYSDISQEAISLKRKQILLTRKIKNNGKDQNSDYCH